MAPGQDNPSSQEAINRRFLLVMKALIAADRVRTQKELCAALGKGETFPTDVRNKKSSVEPALLAQLARDYGVNIRFMLFGEEPMLSDQKAPSDALVNELITELKASVTTLRSELTYAHQREGLLVSLLEEERAKNRPKAVSDGSDH